MNTYCVNKRGFQFLSLHFLFLRLSFSFSPLFHRPLSTVPPSFLFSFFSPLNPSLSQQENTQTLSAARFKPSARFIHEKTKRCMTYHTNVICTELDHKLIEMGSRNNSWVENLPLRPLAPRRKTPGQLYPIKNGPPGKTN